MATAEAKEHTPAGVEGWGLGGSGTKNPDDRGGWRSSSNKEKSVREMQDRQPLGICGVCICVRVSVCGGLGMCYGRLERNARLLLARPYLLINHVNSFTHSSTSSLHVHVGNIQRAPVKGLSRRCIASSCLF